MKIFRIHSLLKQESEDKIIRDKMLGHEVEPPSFIWSSIQAQLPEPKRRKYGNLTYLLPVAACIMGMVFFILPSEKRIIDTGISQSGSTQNTEQSLSNTNNLAGPATGLQGLNNLNNNVNNASADEATAGNPGVINNTNILDGSHSIYTSPFRNKATGGNAPVFNIFPSPDITSNTVKAHDPLGMLSYSNKYYSLVNREDMLNKSRVNAHLENDGYRAASRNPLSVAQNEFRHRFQIGLTYSYANNGSNRSFRDLDDEPSYAPRDPNTGMLMPANQYLKIRSGNNRNMSAGVEVRYSLGKNLSLASGLRYSQNIIGRTTAFLGPDPLNGASANPADIATMREELKTASLRGWSQSQVDALTQQLNALTAGQAVYSSPTRTTVKTIEVPAQLRYTVDLKNFSIYIQGGATGRYVTSATDAVTTPDGSIQTVKSSGLRKMQLLGSAQGGCAVKITNSIGFEGGPFIGKNLIKTGDNNADNLKLFNIGATAGIFYHL